MEGSYPTRLRVWESPTSIAAPLPPRHPATGLTPAGPAGEPHGDEAARLYAREALHSLSARRRPDPGAEPYTLQWFLAIEGHRYGRHGRWIPRLLEFSKHAGETLLGVGHGLGTDWLQYARHGASVIACAPSAAELGLVRKNFELRGLQGRFLHASPASLPLDSASIDVACVSDLLHVAEDPRKVVEEVYRVLKPGGKVLAVTPAKYDVDFWSHAWFFWQRWLGRRGSRPSVRYSARGLKRLFGQFVEHRVHKRQLRRSDVPHVWRVWPLPLLERLMGKALVLKAFKPLSAALPTQAAA